MSARENEEAARLMTIPGTMAVVVRSGPVEQTPASIASSKAFALLRDVTGRLARVIARYRVRPDIDQGLDHGQTRGRFHPAVQGSRRSEH